MQKFVSIGGTFGPLPVPPLVPFTALLAAGVIFVLRRTRSTVAGSTRSAATRARRGWHWSTRSGPGPSPSRSAPVSRRSPASCCSGFSGSAYAAVGAPYLFQTIAAVVIGGTVLIGGRGGYLGTVAGAYA